MRYFKYHIFETLTLFFLVLFLTDVHALDNHDNFSKEIELLTLNVQEEQVLYSTDPKFSFDRNSVNILIEHLKKVGVQISPLTITNEEDVKIQINQFLNKTLPITESAISTIVPNIYISLINDEIIIRSEYSHKLNQKENPLNNQVNKVIKEKGLFHHLNNFVSGILKKLIAIDKPSKYYISKSKWINIYDEFEKKTVTYFINVSLWTQSSELDYQNNKTELEVQQMIRSLNYPYFGLGSCQIFEQEKNIKKIIRIIIWDRSLLFPDAWNIWEVCCPGARSL